MLQHFIMCCNMKCTRCRKTGHRNSKFFAPIVKLLDFNSTETSSKMVTEMVTDYKLSKFDSLRHCARKFHVLLEDLWTFSGRSNLQIVVIFLPIFTCVCLLKSDKIFRMSCHILTTSCLYQVLIVSPNHFTFLWNACYIFCRVLKWPFQLYGILYHFENHFDHSCLPKLTRRLAVGIFSVL